MIRLTAGDKEKMIARVRPTTCELVKIESSRDGEVKFSIE
jgi:hypothetical protein